jgi:hypothetical protein
MKECFLFSVLVLTGLFGCKKEHGSLSVKGEVVQKGGCYSDTWIVEIKDPDFSRHTFLKPAAPACDHCFNCSNAVYIHLPASLAKKGKKIRFEWVETEFSCSASTEAPNHISVKNLSAR